MIVTLRRIISNFASKFNNMFGSYILKKLYEIWGIPKGMGIYNNETGEFDTKESTREYYAKQLDEAINATGKSHEWIEEHIIEAAEARGGEYDEALENVWYEDEALDNLLKLVIEIGDSIEG